MIIEILAERQGLFRWVLKYIVAFYKTRLDNRLRYSYLLANPALKGRRRVTPAETGGRFPRAGLSAPLPGGSGPKRPAGILDRPAGYIARSMGWPGVGNTAPNY